MGMVGGRERRLCFFKNIEFCNNSRLVAEQIVRRHSGTTEGKEMVGCWK